MRAFGKTGSYGEEQMQKRSALFPIQLLVVVFVIIAPGSLKGQIGKLTKKSVNVVKKVSSGTASVAVTSFRVSSSAAKNGTGAAVGGAGTGASAVKSAASGTAAAVRFTGPKIIRTSTDAGRFLVVKTWTGTKWVSKLVLVRSRRVFKRE